MSNTPIVVSVLALVLVGMLFGLNFQVSDSAVTFFNAMGTTLSGVGAATAAYISYLSIGQWKNQFNHSLMYNYINSLEALLESYRHEFYSEAIGRNDLTMWDHNLPIHIGEKTSKEYVDIYRKAVEICPQDKKSYIQNANLHDVLKKVTIEFNNFLPEAIKYQKLVARAEKEEQESTQNKNQLSIDMTDSTDKMTESISEMLDYFDTAINSLRDLRSSL